MADVLAEMVVKILGDSKSLDKTLDKTERNLKDTGKTSTKMSKTMASAGALIQTAFVAVIVAGAIKIGKELISAASKAEETTQKFGVTFSSIRDEADAVAENLSENFGLSQEASENLLASTGDLLTGFGFTQKASLDLADQVNVLAADLASFTNFAGGTEGASVALTKALLGETESVKALGIVIRQDTVEYNNLVESIMETENVDKLQAKALAALTIATEQSKNAIGDFARSQDSFANQTRISEAAVTDFKTELGKGLLPAATNIVTVFGKIGRSLADTQAEFNNLKDIINEFEDTGEVSGGLSDLIAKRQLLIDIQLKQGRNASLMNNEELAAINAAIDAEQKHLNLQRIADGYDRDANAAAAAAAEQAALDAKAESEAAAQRLLDIEFRDAAWGKTEEARIFAIEAEIAELETFKESDERAQEALAFLREELAGFTDDVEESTQAQSNFIQDYTLDAIEWNRKLEEDRAEKHQLELDRIEEEKQAREDAAMAVYGALTGLADAYFASQLSRYDEDSQAYKDIQLQQFNFNKGKSAIDAAISGSVAVMKALELGPIAGPIAAGIIGGFTAAQVGFILAQKPPAFAEGGIVMPSPGGTIAQVAEAGQPEVIFPLDKLESLLGTTSGGGQTIVFNNLISTGSEAEMRLAARKFTTFVNDENSRRGGL